MYSVTYPSRFMLVLAMNPCLCGRGTDPRRQRRCTGGEIQRYMSRLSGPLLDRIDIRVGVGRSSGSGTWALTSPQRRVLDANHVLIAGFDWATCTWDAVALELYWLFDSTVAGLTAPGYYYVQFRGTIGTELCEAEVAVQVTEFGP
jgi:hypothetical protein